MNAILRTKIFPTGLTINLVQGDITLAEVKGIVNPANSRLQHGGGLAGLLAHKAGPTLQKESNLWVRDHGPVLHKSPAFTKAGNLPFDYIIHAVGPVWGSGEEKTKLGSAVRGSLDLAEDLELESLALPAISTGIFGYPLEQAADVILGVIKEFAEQDRSPLKNLQVVLFDEKSAAAFAAAWDQILK